MVDARSQYARDRCNISLSFEFGSFLLNNSELTSVSGPQLLSLYSQLQTVRNEVSSYLLGTRPLPPVGVRSPTVGPDVELCV